MCRIAPATGLAVLPAAGVAVSDTYQTSDTFQLTDQPWAWQACAADARHQFYGYPARLCHRCRPPAPKPEDPPQPRRGRPVTKGQVW